MFFIPSVRLDSLSRQRTAGFEFDQLLQNFPSPHRIKGRIACCDHLGGPTSLLEWLSQN
jgi:hypothetical protein